ncbi:GEVED domain-containing protein [Psychroserpens sp. Hel_I_66]|uniref:GEVED domain-containing protein n=1 Tax=Psychroserpens sp. Hel_I_66 TaxID=1250004 RepID=UPI0009E02D07|nr:GEVED domain-containing protein [Psychroserpens sp. Hel_I_66]
MIKKILLLIFYIGFLNSEIQAQCPVFNANSCTANAPTVIGNSVACTTLANNGGRRNFEVSNMIAGATYRVANCGSGLDTQMTIRNAVGTYIDYNDDDGPACAGLTASIDFIPPATGTYRIQINKYNCATGPNTSNGNIVVTLLSAPYNPCSAVSNIAACGINTTSTFSAGIGAVAGACTFLADGRENVYTFTPTITGNHSIQQISSTNYVDYYYKPVSAGCGSTGWTCTGAELDGAATGGAFALTAGTQYYIMVDPEFSTGGSAVFNIVCPGAITYCSPTTETPNDLYITNVSFEGTLEDTSNNSTFSGGYEDYTGLTPIARQVEGEGVNISVAGNASARFKAWIDWNNDGNFDDNPATELVYDTNGVTTATTTFGFVIPLGTTPGDYRIRIRNNLIFDWLYFFYDIRDFGPCENFFFNGSTLYEDFGEAEDYLFTVEPYCDAIVTSVIDGDTCGPGSVTLDVTATGAPSISEYRWYANETGGAPIATTATGTWNTPSISTTTTYWVSAFNGSCESWVRTPIVANYNPIPTLTVTPDVTDRVICGENDALEISAIGDVDDVYLIDEDFEDGTLGVFFNTNITNNGGAINALTQWRNRTSTYVPNEEVWYPAISSGFGPNQFVMSNSDVGAYITHNALTTTNSYNTTDFTSLTLSFRGYYSHYLTDGDGGTDFYAAIEVSTDGTNWTSITPNIIADVGIGTKFETLSYNLDAYINQPTLSLRFRFYQNWGDGIAIDDIKLFGDQDITAVNWSTTPAGIIDLFIDTDNDNVGDTPYTTGAFTTVYAIPNITQLETASYSFTINATLSNNCGAATLPFTITNNTKIWNGSNDNTWDNPDNWFPNGAPTSDNCVIIGDVGTLPDPTILGPPIPPVPAFARNLTIKNNGFLELEPSSSLTVTDWINVDPNGTFNVRNRANLVQVTNVVANINSGSINMDREVTGLTSQDYVYWSSPVENFGVGGVSPGTNPAYVLNWIPTVVGNGAGNYGEWQTTAENMIPGKGYAIRALTGTSVANTAQFAGRPSNGIVTTPIVRGSYTGADYPGAGVIDATALDDNWNLVGNPFPSSINADTFISMNASTIIDDANPSIAGTIYLWSHASAPSNLATDPFYGDYVYNYNANDYIAYNLTGSTPSGFGGFIGAGQAFFVLMDNAAATPSNLIFDNTMRNGVFDNIQFYRTDDPVVTEKHRIWLDLIDADNNANSILVGYITGATNENDRLFDGNQLSGSNNLFYSLIGDDKMAIQGRSLPFNVTDIVPLGFNTAQNGNYSIAINILDGLFESTDQDIFIEDMYTNTIHNLRLSPYNFSTESGTFDDRFILRYTNETLSVNQIDNNGDISILAPNSEYIKVTSKIGTINTIAIYDIVGREILNINDINQSEIILNQTRLSDGAYIVKVKLDNNKQKVQKVVLKQ